MIDAVFGVRKRDRIKICRKVSVDTNVKSKV